MENEIKKLLKDFADQNSRTSLFDFIEIPPWLPPKSGFFFDKNKGLTIDYDTLFNDDTLEYIAITGDLDSAKKLSSQIKLVKDLKLNIEKKLKSEKDIKKKKKIYRTKKSDEVLKAKKFINENIFNNQKLRNASDESEQLQILIDEIRKIKEPPLQKFVLYFFLPLLVLIIYRFAEPLIDEARSEIAFNTKPKITNKIKRETKKVAEEKFKELGFKNVPLANKRIVIAKKLNVREKPTKKSNIIGFLEIGNLVTVIEKRKNWALIEFKYYQSGASIKGWVFTRYIKRIDK